MKNNTPINTEIAGHALEAFQRLSITDHQHLHRETGEYGFRQRLNRKMKAFQANDAASEDKDDILRLEAKAKATLLITLTGRELRGIDAVEHDAYLTFETAVILLGIEVTTSHHRLNSTRQPAVSTHEIGAAAHECKTGWMALGHQTRPEKIKRFGQDHPIVAGGNYIRPGISGKADPLGKLSETGSKIWKTFARREGIGANGNRSSCKIGARRPIAAVDRDFMPNIRKDYGQLPDSGLDATKRHGGRYIDKGDLHRSPESSARTTCSQTASTVTASIA